MRTVITHFFNESFLLPFWLKHHLPLFDSGILIDHGSSDESAAICRQLAPHWRHVRSRLDCFDAALTDAEVMYLEWQTEGFKIALNTTEFLVATSDALDWLEQEIGHRTGVWLEAKVMIDAHPGVLPDAEIPLLQSKPDGLCQGALRTQLGAQDSSLNRLMQINRGRLYHQAPSGCYRPGRHSSELSSLGHCDRSLAHICWFAFSPWCGPFIQRKLGIRSRLSEAGLKLGQGFQHAWSQADMEANFRALSGITSRRA